MEIPLFSKREVLQFLIAESRRYEATSEEDCWYLNWDTFFPGSRELPSDGPFLKFKSACLVYGYQPHPIAGGRWRMQNVELVKP